MNFDASWNWMMVVSALGLPGLLILTISERVVPISSFALLLAAGMAAADGIWSLPAAFIATTAGSFLGYAAWFNFAIVMGRSRYAPPLFQGRLSRLTADHISQAMNAVSRHQLSFAFSAQLLPIARQFSPALAALPQVNALGALAASAGGICIWNFVMLMVGYTTARETKIATDPSLAFGALAALLMIQVVAIRMWNWSRARKVAR